MKLRTLLLGSALATCAPVSQAFETETHALITNQAYTNSVLTATGPSSTVHNLGLDRLDVATPFNIYWGAPVFDPDDGYWDNLANQIQTPAEFERCNMQEFLNPDPAHPAVPPQFSLLFQSTVEAVGDGNLKFPIQNWLVRGAVREDDLGPLAVTYFGARCGVLTIPITTSNIVRVLNHFYDPINNAGLGSCPPLLGPCQKSVDWGLGVLDSFPPPPQLPQPDPNRANHFSYEDARNAMWLALTQEVTDRNVASAYRLYQWATVFRDLGDVVHLLQDTAQPQHVRNDPHSNFQTPEQQALEGFTNARVLGQPVSAIGGDGGFYVREFFGANLSAVINAPPLGSYGAVSFATPLRFFTTRAYADTSATDPSPRLGLADYSNRGLFTAGTLPGSSTDPYAYPPQTIDTVHGYTAVPVPCLFPTPTVVNAQQRVSCTHYTRTVPDTVNAGYASSDVFPPGFTAPPLVADGAFSVFINSFMGGSSTVSEKAIGIEELITTGNLTIPRAVGYSTGMLNFFFRGTIQVDVPQDGLFGVVDHGMAHTVDANGYPHCTATIAGAAGEPDFCTAGAVYGFTKIRLKLHNSTPAITESGPAGPALAQAMLATSATPAATDPRLVAVARYHRNLCYQATLLGEAVVDYQGTVTENACGAGNRSSYQEISVSKPAAVTAPNLNGTSSTPVTFDFSNDPIPVNATDLFIQVVYRGQLGNEPDGIAVGTIDVREPTYITMWNDSDHAGCNGVWVTGNATGCTFVGGVFRQINIAYLNIGGQSLYHHFNTGGPANIDSGHYVRLAALLDDQPHTTKASLSVGGNGQAACIIKTVTGDTRQASMEHESVDALYVPDTMFIKRGVIGSFRPMPFYQLIGADPQPSSDAGANDVGSLLPVYTTIAADPGGVMMFPNQPPSPVTGCN